MSVYYISAFEHQIFENHFCTPYNIPLIMGDRHKNFKDPMLRSWAIALVNMQRWMLIILTIVMQDFLMQLLMSIIE